MTGESTWRFLQVCMAGGFVLAALNVGTLKNTASRIKRIVESDRELLGSLVDASANAGQRTLRPDKTFLNLAEQVRSLGDMEPYVDEVSHHLLNSMTEDDLVGQRPFGARSQVYPTSLIVGKGIRNFSREALRSPGFEETLGYDIVSYKIFHDDGSKSRILAYRKNSGLGSPTKTGRSEKSDDQPLFTLFLIDQDQDQVLMSLYENGRILSSALIDRDEAETQVQVQLGNATPLVWSQRYAGP